MKVGMIGCGKLGKMIGVGMALRGVEVMGYDVNPDAMTPTVPDYEETPAGFEWPASFTFGTINEVIGSCELTFFAVQTPHERAYEGITPAPHEPKDFDYSYIKDAVRAAEAVMAWSCTPPRRTFVIISTMLPGTCERELIPLVRPNVTMLYNPSFIAMGSTLRDFWNPELVLVGCEGFSRTTPVAHSLGLLMAVYRQVYGSEPPLHLMSYASAELAKVAYNTAISQKIVLANTLMEICHKIPGTNVDDVTGVLQAAINRVASPAYMSGGMGDGGACHPRDNIAMMKLASRLHLHADPFTFATRGREAQAEWLADLMLQHRNRRPLIIVGTAYKPDCSLEFGSPALLVRKLLANKGVWVQTYDPIVNPNDQPPWDEAPVCVLIGCRHSAMGEMLSTVPVGSTILDPFRLGFNKAGIEYIPIGIGQHMMNVPMSCEDVQ